MAAALSADGTPAYDDAGHLRAPQGTNQHLEGFAGIRAGERGLAVTVLSNLYRNVARWIDRRFDPEYDPY
jgi:hypothetical protein